MLFLEAHITCCFFCCEEEYFNDFSISLKYQLRQFTWKRLVIGGIVINLQILILKYQLLCDDLLSENVWFSGK